MCRCSIRKCIPQKVCGDTKYDRESCQILYPLSNSVSPCHILYPLSRAIHIIDMQVCLYYLPPADRPGTGDYKMPDVRPCVRAFVRPSVRHVL